MKKHIEDIHSYLTSNHEFWMNESNVVRPDVLWFSVENTDRLLLKIKKRTSVKSNYPISTYTYNDFQQAVTYLGIWATDLEGLRL